MAKVEIWKEVPDHPGWEASSLGQLRSYRNNRWGRSSNWRLLKPYVNRAGYPVTKYGRGHDPICVHTLILTTFKGSCPKGNWARHLNDVKTDNRIVNLEWGTPAENSLDQKRNRGDGSHLTEAQAEDVIRRSTAGEAITAIARDLAVSYIVIWRVKTGASWRHLPRSPKLKPKPRLSPKKIEAIQTASGLLREIAELYGVSIATVSSIRTAVGLGRQQSLSPSKVEAIRTTPGTLREVAELYGVSSTTVGGIRTGKRHKQR